MNLERAVQRPFWSIHRALFRISGGRIGTQEPSDKRVGTLVLTTTGHKTGQERSTPVFFIRDGDRFVIAASNSGDERDPAWYLNLSAHPEASVSVGAPRQVPVRARDASEEERSRLWPELARRFSGYARYERRTQRQIPVVILEPR